MKGYKHILVLIVFIGITISQNNNAQEKDSTRLPALGDHVFTTITNVQDPFIKTKFVLNVGIANLFNTEIPVTLTEINKTISFKPKIFFVVGGLEYQQAINNWSALYLTTFGAARVGINLLSIATQGISAASIFKIGMLFNIVENENLSFSASMGLTNSSLTFISLQNQFDGIETDSSQYQIINSFQVLTGNLQLSFAYKFSSILGLIVSGTGGYGEIYELNSDSEFNWLFGTALSVDLNNWIHIPFGVGFGGTVGTENWSFLGTNDPVYTVNLNLSFINQNDLSISWENYIQILKQYTYNKTFYFHYSRIYLNYYF
jgi:hypothetical protein